MLVSTPITTKAGATHPCPGCGRHIYSHHFACQTDWFRLPVDLRKPIHASYGRAAAAYSVAVANAMEWYRANPVTTSGGAP
jgi:hypothetical protein